MKIVVLKSILFVLIFSSVIKPQVVIDSSGTDNLSIYLRDVHLDLTTVILQNDITLSSDINIYKFGKSFFGLQPGVGFLTVSGLYNNVLEEPFIDYNLAGIFSMKNRHNAYIQLLLGYVYRTSTKNDTKDYPLSMTKYGISLGWDVSKHINLYIKFSQVAGKPGYKGSAAGLGLSIGFWN